MGFLNRALFFFQRHGILALFFLVNGQAATTRDVVYVVTRSNLINVIDISSNQVIGTIPSASAEFFIAFTPDGAQAWAPFFVSPGLVNIIDTASSTSSSVVSVGSFGTGIAFNNAGTEVYIANIGGSNVTIVNVATHALIKTIAVGASPHGLAFSPDQTKVYVANAAANTLSIINTTTQTVSSTIAMGTDPHGVAFTPDGTKAYVTNRVSNNLSVINVALGTVSSTIASGGGQPSGIAIRGTKAYVTNDTSNTVTIIDTASDTVVNTISVGQRPLEIAISPDGTRAYTANRNSNDVSVIDLSSETVIATIAIIGAQPSAIATTTIPSSPPSPSSSSFEITGACKQNRFLTQTTFYNELFWDSISDTVLYRVYRNEALTILAGETRQPTFMDLNRAFGTAETYFIVSVNSSGTETFLGQITIAGCSL